MARKSRKVHASTNDSLGWINHIHASDVDNLSSTKRRRTAQPSVYDLPVSPERPQRPPRIEPINTGRELRSRQKPSLVQPESSSSSFDEEDGESIKAETDSEKSDPEPNDRESSSGENENDNNGEEYQADNESGNGNELDPLPRPLHLFSDEDEDGHEDGNSYGESDKDDDTDKPEDNPIDETSDDPSAQVQAESTFIPPSDVTIEVGTPKSTVRNQSEGSHPIDAPKNGLRSLSIDSSPPREIHETPSTHQPLSDRPASAPHAIFKWLAETIEGSGFKEVWEDIRKTRSAIKPRADPSMREPFNHIKRMIYRLRGLYKTTAELANSDFSTRRDWRNQCSLIANNIFKEVQWIIYDEAQNDEEGGATLVDQLEAHIIPLLVELVLFGFKAYMLGGNWVERSFCTSLDLLWGCSYKISSFADLARHIGFSVIASSRKLMPLVKTLKDALNNGILRETAHGKPYRPQPYRHFELTEVESRISCAPWTRKESDALRRAYESALADGLTGKTISLSSSRSLTMIGDALYIDIKCDLRYSYFFSERIIRQVQAEAIELGLDDG
jgi:hypothetical protein